MKLARFRIDSNIYQGFIENESIRVIKGNVFGNWSYTGKVFPTGEVEYLAPIEPNQIIGIGANYVKNLDDLPSDLPNIPVFFFKPNSSVIGPNDYIRIPSGIDSVKFESELAIVIGKEAKNVSESDVMNYIFGYTIGNDVTSPQFFHQDGHWTIGKSFDTFTPLGPIIQTELNPSEVRVKARLNGVEKQNSGTELMIMPIRKMLSYLSTIMTLKPGDVILTGSPVGAEFVGTEDVIECEVQEIGILKNTFMSMERT